MNVFIKVTSQVSVLESVLNSLKADLKKQYYIHHVSLSFTFVLFWVFQFQGQIDNLRCWWHNIGDTMLVIRLVKRMGDISDRKGDRISNIWIRKFGPKMPKMTEIGKTRIQNSIKVGYFEIVFSIISEIFRP